MESPTLLHTLSSFSLFDGFTAKEIQEIVDAGDVLHLEPGVTLIAPGMRNNSLFLLIEGELKVVLQKDNAEVTIAIPPGECLGEMSIVTGIPTSAHVSAQLPCQVLALSASSFWDKLATKRAGVQNLLRMMAERLQRNNDALIERVEKQLKYQLMEKELEMAGTIQSEIVPDGTSLFPNFPTIEAFALIDQAREVGGDFYDAVQLDDQHIYFAIGDVSGKGMPAALLMVRLVNSLRLFLDNSPHLADIMPGVNRWLAKDNASMMFASVFVGILNVQTGLLRYVGAGHNPPFISRNGEPFQSIGLAQGLFLGITEEATFPVEELTMEAGDTLVLYTDGITEARNKVGLMYEMDRVQTILETYRKKPVQDLVVSLEKSVIAFVGEAPQVDDYTLFGLRYLG
jgi:sigma-B regulation protein RsbU (phosphoserine phosphatase)